MALGKKSRSCNFTRSGLINGGVDNDEGFELGLVNYARPIEKKRDIVSNNGSDTISRTPSMKKRCVRDSTILNPETETESETCALQALPGDILIHIVSGVDHDDLSKLYNVATFIREAALVAEEMHFAFSTPKKVPAFRTAIDLENLTEDIEAPNAPKQTRARGSRLEGKKFGSISVNLFGEQ
ncbi:hypothetical protein CsatA_020997 [Cannabis sativa]